MYLWLTAILKEERQVCVSKCPLFKAMNLLFFPIIINVLFVYSSYNLNVELDVVGHKWMFGYSPFKICVCMLQPCFPGLISSEDRADCRLCPAGFTCDPTLGTLSLCPSGQHSPEGVLQCLACPVDSICTSGFPLKVIKFIQEWVKSVREKITGNDQSLIFFPLYSSLNCVFQCEPGQEPSADQTVCNDCPPGFYSNMCTIQCLLCPAGNAVIKGQLLKRSALTTVIYTWIAGE